MFTLFRPPNQGHVQAKAAASLLEHRQTLPHRSENDPSTVITWTSIYYYVLSLDSGEGSEYVVV